MSNMQLLKVEIPKFNRCFLCLPLRGGIIAWCLLEISCSFLSVVYILTMFGSMFFPNNVALLFISFLFWITNGVIGILLIYSIYENNIRYINNCYTYYVIKWCSYVVLLFIALVLLGCDYPTQRDFYRNLDLVTRYTMFDQISLGFLCFLLLGYFALLIRSLILNLGGTPRVSLKPQRFKITCVTAEDPELQRIAAEENPDETSGIDVEPPKYEEVMNGVEPVVISVAFSAANACQMQSSGCNPITESRDDRASSTDTDIIPERLEQP